ncbi:zinc finger protein 2 [Apiospora kogelbergensis]|uniref:zinc finger protein 2 n=1 Tax=Apiospora kogelbergensis TaxID=1337665 RepID=UPI0031305E0D
MAPTLSLRAAIARRSDLSNGAIAGAVVGSVVGGSLVFLVLLFFYFRFRRRRLQAAAQADITPFKPPIERRVSFPGQTDASQAEQGSTAINGRVEPGGSVYSMEGNFQPSPIATNDGNNYTNYTQSPQHSQQGFVEGAVLGGSADAYYANYPIGEPSAAASYYNMDIAMESDPNLPPMAPPSRQMTELYREQLKQARDLRKKERQSSKGSVMSRVINSLRRKRSSKSSSLASPVDGSPISRQADVPFFSVEGAEGPGIYAEPQAMGNDSGSDLHRAKKKKHDESYSSAGHPRLDSLNTVLKTEPPLDPSLPSSAYHRTDAPAEPYHDASRFSNERLQSPDIPEPMEGAPYDDVNSQGLRASHSPTLQSDSFIAPIDIFQPSNDAEKAAHTHAELERYEKSSSPTYMGGSASPPAFTGVHTNNGPVEDEEDEDEDYSEDEDDTQMQIDHTPYPVGNASYNGVNGQGLAHNPSRITPDNGLTPSVDHSTPGHSSSNPSAGVTPDTRITASPSSNENIFIKQETSTSPESYGAIPSPQTPHSYTCDECNRAFDQLHKLNHHKRYHDRKHECPYPNCDKRFGTKTHLDRHINDKHEKKKGFHCPEPGCPYFKGGKAFPRKDNWRRHMQNKHNITPTIDPEAMDQTLG